jgi:hypothetical protein
MKFRVKSFQIVSLIVVFGLMQSCTFETRNQISRSIQNWTGTNGVVDVLSAGKVMYRFVNVEKLTTASASDGSQQARPYRFGYGVLDLNQNYRADAGEKKVYFEVSEYSTQYLYYENPAE